MFNYLKLKWMAFKDIFKDDNDINEKSVVGFAAFVIMVLFAIVDLVTGYVGKDLVINEFIYDSFVLVVLGAFGIAEAGKIFGGKK
jgi:small-conductance mechanosensitive channel